MSHVFPHIWNIYVTYRFTCAHISYVKNWFHCHVCRICQLIWVICENLFAAYIFSDICQHIFRYVYNVHVC